MKRRRGFSLLEVMLCSGLMVAIAGLTAVNFLQGGASTLKQDVVEGLQAEIRATQLRAQKENKFVALVLAGPNSTQLGIEVGRGLPRQERVRDFAKDFPDVWLTVDLPTEFASPDPRLADAWFRNGRSAIIFTPSGRIFSNLAAGGDGAYHFQLYRGSGGSWDLAFSPQGNFAMLETSSAHFTRPLSTNLSSTTFSNSAPRLTNLKVMSSKTEERDVNGYLHLQPVGDELFSFRVEAQDNDGDDQLFLQARGPGSFSSAQAAPMHFEASSGRWVGYSTWQPPKTLAGGAELTFDVVDRYGLPASSNANSKILLDGFAQEFLVFAGKPNKDKFNTIYRCNPDGSGLRGIFAKTGPASDLACPVPSPSGTMVAYCDYDGSWPPSLAVANLDGTNRRVLIKSWNLPGGCEIRWSRDSNEVLATLQNAGTNQIVAVPSKGVGSPRVLVNNVNAAEMLTSPDHQKLGYYVRGNPYPAPGHVEILDLASAARTTVATDSAAAQLNMGSSTSSYAWSPDSSTYFYTSYNAAQAGTIYSFSGSGPPQVVLNTGGRVQWLRVGPDRKLAYLIFGSGYQLFVVDDYSTPASPRLLASRPSSSMYVGAVDNLAFSRDGKSVYWMQGKDPGSTFLRYDFSTGKSQKLALATDYFNLSGGNYFDLVQAPP